MCCASGLDDEEGTSANVPEPPAPPDIPVEETSVVVADVSATGFDKTHKIRRIKTVWYCSVCGAWGATRPKELLRQCKGGATAAGRRVLYRLSKGMPPKSSTDWSDARYSFSG